MLDMNKFYPEVYQAVAGDDYVIYVYMNDGAMRKYDVKPLLQKGGVFEPLRDKTLFRKTLTVIGGTAAWDLEGNRDESRCIDLDPMDLFLNGIVVDDLFL